MHHYLKTLFLLLLTVVSLLIIYVFTSSCVFNVNTVIQEAEYEQYIIVKENQVQNETPRTQHYNVWCVFTKIKGNEHSLESKLKNMLVSLLNSTATELNLNLVVDTSSRYVAKEVVHFAQKITRKRLEVQYFDVHVITNKLQDLLEIMRPHFSSQPGGYYSDSLFFISMGLYRTAPADQDKVIMLDVDTIIKEDIIKLFNIFNDFNSTTVFGACPELTPVYHHILYTYRYKHKKTFLGEPHSTGGFPGVNSGVLLLHLENMRRSILYQSMLTKEIMQVLTDKYSFKGHLGDQDFYTLISLEHPELLYLVDCGWNRQLCTWWREHGYMETFQKFAECHSSTKIYHGNCNSKIPEQ